MIANLLRRTVTHLAQRHGRALALYRRLCRPDGYAWANLVRRHGGLHGMGERCFINPNVTITDPAYVRLGSNVHLSGCTLFGHDGAVRMLAQAHGLALDKVGKIEVRDHVFIGHQAIIMPGVCIGPHAIVAAGAVVTADVAPGSIVGGVPARVIGQVAQLLARCQADTGQLPWRHHPCLASQHTGGASADLEALRVAHFFGMAAP